MTRLFLKSSHSMLYLQKEVQCHSQEGGQKEGISCIADGVNADDLDDYRPALRLQRGGNLASICRFGDH